MKLRNHLFHLPLQYVVCVHNRGFSSRRNAVNPQTHYVRIGPYENSHAAKIRPDLTNRIGNIIIKKVLLTVISNHGYRQEPLKASCYTHRAGTRPTAPVRRCECLVQIQVNNVKPHITGPDFAQNRIEIRPIIVEETASLMNDTRDLHDVPFEDAECVRVSDHQPGCRLARSALQRRQVYHSLSV